MQRMKQLMILLAAVIVFICVLSSCGAQPPTEEITKRTEIVEMNDRYGIGEKNDNNPVSENLNSDSSSEDKDNVTDDNKTATKSSANANASSNESADKDSVSEKSTENKTKSDKGLTESKTDSIVTAPEKSTTKRSTEKTTGADENSKTNSTQKTTAKSDADSNSNKSSSKAVSSEANTEKEKTSSKERVSDVEFEVQSYYKCGDNYASIENIRFDDSIIAANANGFVDLKMVYVGNNNSRVRIRYRAYDADGNIVRDSYIMAKLDGVKSGDTVENVRFDVPYNTVKVVFEEV